MTAQTARFEALDGLRGIAALGVTLMHFAEFMPFGVGHAQMLGLVHGNHLAVDFFFVLSGFVLAHATFGRIETRHDLAVFVIRRFGRIWPLHGALLLGMIVVALLVGLVTGTPRLPVPAIVQDGGATLLSALLLNGVIFRPGLSWNFPSWSISAEFWANVVLAGVILASPRRIGRHALAIAIAALALCYVLVPDNFMHGRLAPLRCLVGVFAGVAAYHVFRASNRPLAMPTLVEGLTVLITLAVVMFASSPQAAFAAPLVFGCVVIVFAKRGGDVSRLLQRPLPMRLGAWSYSIYLVHIPLIAMLYTIAAVLAGLGYDWPPAALQLTTSMYGQDLIVVIYLVSVAMLASLTYRWIELPARDYVNRHAARIAAVQVPSWRRSAFRTP